MQSLRTLDVSTYEERDSLDFTHLPQLRELRAGSFALCVDFEKLGELTQLEALDLQCTCYGFDDSNYRPFKPLSNLVNLRALNLKGHNIGAAGMEILGGLTQLEVLDLDIRLGASDTKLSAADVTPIGALSGLRHLDVGGYGVGPDIPRILSGLTQLRTLVLPGEIRREGPVQIGSEGAEALGVLTNLEELDLRGNSIDDAGLMHLEGLVKLRALNLSWNRLDGKGVRRGDTIQGKALKALEGMRDLRRLNLRHNDINAESVKTLAKCVNLEELDLSENKLISDGLEALGGMSKLKVLKLGPDSSSFRSGLDVTPKASAALGRLTELRRLELSSSSIIDATFLGKLNKLEHLYLRCSALPPAPDAFQGLEQLEVLKLKLKDTFNARLSDQISVFSSANNLEELELSARLPHLRALTNMKYLRKVDLSGSYIKDPTPEFWSLPGLEEVKFGYGAFGVSPYDFVDDFVGDSSDSFLSAMRKRLARMEGENE